MHGIHIGLINIADSSSGLSIELINWVNKGYHKLSLSPNEVLNYQAGIKTGNAKLYSILIGAATFREGEKAYSAGFGLGHDFIFANRFSASEVSSQGIYLGNFDAKRILNRAQINMQFQVMKGICVFAGPSYWAYYTGAAEASAVGFKKRIAPASAHTKGSTSRWIGWSAGITIL